MRSKRTKALAISRSVKEAVWKRQGGHSIFSGYPISVEECCCHFIPRSHGGLGIEENIFGATWQEHQVFDLNLVGDWKRESDLMHDMAVKHFKLHYPNWSRERLKYKK